MQYHAKPCNTIQNHAIPCNTMQYHAIPCNTMQYNAIPCNTKQYHAIPSNTMQYHAIPCNTMQYYAIQCNTMQYHAIPCIINNCWRSVPLPCGQYNGHFFSHKACIMSLFTAGEICEEMYMWLWVFLIIFRFLTIKIQTNIAFFTSDLLAEFLLVHHDNCTIIKNWLKDYLYHKIFNTSNTTKP